GRAVGREDETRFERSGLWAVAKRLERRADRARDAGRDMDVFLLEHAPKHIRRIGGGAAQPPNGRLLVPEGGKKGERKFLGVEWLAGELGHGFFNFDGVHEPCPATRPLRRDIAIDSPSRGP